MIELAVICCLLIALCAWQQIDRRAERQEVAAERRDLLLRISETQQQTVVRHFNEIAEPGPPAIDMSDGPMGDESYWKSREELAEQMAAEELAARG